MRSSKPIYVAFAEKKLEIDFENLKKGRFQDKQLYDSINRAILEMKANAACGIKIPKRLWPKEYVRKFGITNLWKFNLPKGWRVVYTIKENKIVVLNVILEWFNHKEYEARFKY